MIDGIAIFLLYFINSLKAAGLYPNYNKLIGDFKVKDYFFEIGGKSKTRKQIKNDLKNSFLVKDDILMADNISIPLYLFGFLY